MHDRSYTDWVEYPYAQLRFVLDTERGRRFDHNPEGTYGHDMTEEGLHMDIYRDGEQYLVRQDFPPVELSRAPAYCVSYIENEADRLLRRFEQWHNLTTNR